MYCTSFKIGRMISFYAVALKDISGIMLQLFRKKFITFVYAHVNCVCLLTWKTFKDWPLLISGGSCQMVAIISAQSWCRAGDQRNAKIARKEEFENDDMFFGIWFTLRKIW